MYIDDPFPVQGHIVGLIAHSVSLGYLVATRKFVRSNELDVADYSTSEIVQYSVEIGRTKVWTDAERYIENENGRTQGIQAPQTIRQNIAIFFFSPDGLRIIEIHGRAEISEVRRLRSSEYMGQRIAHVEFFVEASVAGRLVISKVRCIERLHGGENEISVSGHFGDFPAIVPTPSGLIGEGAALPVAEGHQNRPVETQRIPGGDEESSQQLAILVEPHFTAHVRKIEYYLIECFVAQSGMIAEPRTVDSQQNTGA